MHPSPDAVHRMLGSDSDQVTSNKESASYGRTDLMPMAGSSWFRPTECRSRKRDPRPVLHIRTERGAEEERKQNEDEERMKKQKNKILKWYQVTINDKCLSILFLFCRITESAHSKHGPPFAGQNREEEGLKARFSLMNPGTWAGVDHTITPCDEWCY